MHTSSRSHTLWLPLLLMVLALLCFFDLNFYGLFDGREATFAHATLEMIRQWDFTLPLFDGEASLAHMPLFHHLQAISFSIFEVTAFAARLPAAIAGFLLLLVVYGGASGISGSQRYGVMALMVMGLSLLFITSARTATADILGAFLVFSASMLLFANLYARERSDMRILVAGFIYGFAFIAGAAEALLIPAVVLLLAATFKPHQNYNFKCISPFAIFFAGVLAMLPWAMFVVDAKGLPALQNLWRHYQFAQPQTELQNLWPLLTILVAGLFPWILWLPVATGGVLRNLMHRFTADNPREALPLVGALWAFVGVMVCWLFWPQEPHKLIYALPGFALLIADRFDRSDVSPLGWLGLLMLLPLFALAGWLLVDLPRGWSTLGGWQSVLVNQGMVWPDMPEMPAWLNDSDIQRQARWLGIVIAAAGGVALLLMRFLGQKGVAAMALVMATLLGFGTLVVSKNIYQASESQANTMAEHLKNIYDPEADILVQYAMQNMPLSVAVGHSVPLAKSLPEVFRTPARRYLVVMPANYFVETFLRQYPGHHTVDCFDNMCVVHLFPRLR